MTAIPCGQKKQMSAKIQSQTVAAPLAAIDGTTFRFTMATTKSRTKSRRPSARFSCGSTAEPGFASMTVSGIALASYRCGASLLLRHCQRRGNLLEHGEVLLDIGVSVR